MLHTDRVRQEALRVISQLNLNAKRWEVVIREHKPKRTNAQNRLYWEWLTIIADETGSDKGGLHEHFGGLYLDKRVIEVLGVNIDVPISTTDLDVKGFTEYLNRIEAFAIAELGILLPRPDDEHHEAMLGRCA